MIKIFKNVRQKLIAQKNSSAYLVYAVGEILLVVIGILIAISIDDWHERHKEREDEKEYLEAIAIDLKTSIDRNKTTYIGRIDRKLEGLKLAKSYHEDRMEIQDTLHFLAEISYGGVFSGGFLAYFGSTYDELVSSSLLRLFRDKELKKKVVDFYVTQSNYEKRSKLNESGYSSFLNSLRPFDKNNPTFVSKEDQKDLLEAFKTEEFGRMVDLEITYTNDIVVYIGELEEKAKAIVQLINAR